MNDEWLDITGYGDPEPIFLVSVYGSPLVTFPVRQAFVAELWCDWEWVD